MSTNLLLISGRAIKGLRARFEGGRAVQIDADERDLDANRPGEVALVDASTGSSAPAARSFVDTLLDENAASNIALGTGFTHLTGDEEAAARINQSAVHTDFMIGGPDIEITGVTRDGRKLPVLIAEQRRPLSCGRPRPRQ